MHSVVMPAAVRAGRWLSRNARTSVIVYRPALRMRSASRYSTGTNESSAAMPVR